MKYLFILLFIGLSFSTTIQYCQQNLIDNCVVDTSSTITPGQFFYISNTALTIESGVTIRVDGSTLMINTGTFTLESGALIDGNGEDGQVGSGQYYRLGGDGGTGGSACYDTCNGVPRGFYFVNGTDGLHNTLYSSRTMGGRGCLVPPITELSNQTSRFFSSGAIIGKWGSEERIAMGGSGTSIRIIADTVDISGNIVSSGGVPAGRNYVYVNGASGGEVVILADEYSQSGDITTDGGTGLGINYNPSLRYVGYGGTGGNQYICYVTSYSNLGDNSVQGGANNGRHPDGSWPSAYNDSGSFVATQEVVCTLPNPYNPPTPIELQVYALSSLVSDDDVNVTWVVLMDGVAVTDVDCNYTLNGNETVIGSFDINDSGVQQLIELTSLADDSYYLNVTCSDGGSYTETSNTIFFSTIPPSPNSSITILSPISGVTYSPPSEIPVVIQVDYTYDECSYSINDVVMDTWVPTAYPYDDLLVPSDLSSGSNILEVDCHSSTLYDTASVSFLYIYGGEDTVFGEAFNLTLEDCPVETQIELIQKCTEWYKIPRFFTFSAVVCSNLDPDVDYQCLADNNISDVWKKSGQYPYVNYTIFYTPSYWEYPMDAGATGGGDGRVAAKEFNFISAMFYYNSETLLKGIELIDNTTFVYTEAADSWVDCGVYRGDYCAARTGFIVNDRSIAFGTPGDIYTGTGNVWYTYPGYGVTEYNANYSNPIPISVFMISPLNQIFGGIYTRLQCYVEDDNYVVQLSNTMEQTFSYYVRYMNNDSFIYTTTTRDLYLTFPTTNVSLITVYDGNRYVCGFNEGSANIILPFEFFLKTDGFGNMFITIFMLLTVLMTAFIPYAILITIFFNDMFDILSIGDMATVFVFAVVAGIINNVYSQQRGMKNIMILGAIGLAYLMLMLDHFPSNLTTAPEFQSYHALRALMTSLETLTRSADIVSFGLGTADFIVTFVGFIIQLPMILVNLLFLPLGMIFPASFYAALSAFQVVLTAGLYAWIMIKAYEVITKQYLPM